MPKPKIKNPDGNIFVILGMAQKALRNQPETLEAFKKKTQTAMTDGTDYYGMLSIVMHFVDIEIDEDEDEEDNE